MHARGWEESQPCLPEYHRPEMPADDPILRRICFPLSPLLAQNALIRQKLFYSNILDPIIIIPGIHIFSNHHDLSERIRYPS